MLLQPIMKKITEGITEEEATVHLNRYHSYFLKRNERNNYSGLPNKKSEERDDGAPSIYINMNTNYDDSDDVRYELPKSDCRPNQKSKTGSLLPIGYHTKRWITKNKNREITVIIQNKDGTYVRKTCKIIIPRGSNQIVQKNASKYYFYLTPISNSNF